MKTLLAPVLLVLFAAPVHADASKETPAASARKLPREWQADSHLFAADKEAPSPSKSNPARVAPKLK